MLPGTVSGVRNPSVRALAITRSESLWNDLAQRLAGTGVLLRRETCPERGVALAVAQDLPVVLVAEDSDWRYTARLLEQRSSGPNLIALLPSVDPTLWAEAVQAGMFEVLPLDVDGGRLAWVLLMAQKRWKREQVVSAARSRNIIVDDTVS
jgi:hypothetical protein